MIQFDVKSFLVDSRSVTGGWNALRDLAKEYLNEEMLGSVFNLDIETETRNVSLWFCDYLLKHPLSKEVRTVRASIVEPNGYDLELDLYAAPYSATNPEWFSFACSSPRSLAGSRALFELHQREQNDSGRDSVYIGDIVCVGFSYLAMRRAVHEFRKTKRGKSHRVAVCTGWDDDDRPILVSHI